MEARRLNNNTYDIFQGKQFSACGSGWSRVRQGKHNTYVVAGEKVDHSTLRWLHSVLAPNMPITPGQSMEQMVHNNNAINNTRH